MNQDKHVNQSAIGEEQRILLMDDDPVVRDITAALLERFGFMVLRAVNGEEAVTAFRAARDTGSSFHVVLLDLNVTFGMGGAETIKALRDIDPFVKAVLMTGDVSDPLFREFASHGFYAALAKPYDIQDLISIILNVEHPRTDISGPRSIAAAQRPS